VRLAWTTLGSPSWPAERVFDAAAAAGYDGVELRCLYGGPIPPSLSRADRERIRQLSRDSGLPVVALGASSAFSSPDPGEREAQEADLRAMLELAVDVQTRLVRAYAGSFPPGYDADQVLDWVAGSIARVLPRAEELGVLLVLETHDGLSSAAMAARLLRRLPQPGVQALWDVLHPTKMGETPEEVWAAIGPRVRHVHFKDAGRGADGRWRARLLGQGEVPLRRCLQVLHAHRYAGWLTLEWEKYWEPDIPEPTVALPHMLQATRCWLEEEGIG